VTQASKLREMSVEQLQFQLKEAQDGLFRLRFQAATEKLDAPSSLKKMRREIARVHTVIRQKQPASSEVSE